MTMTFQEVKTWRKQGFPFIMVDEVLKIAPGKKITVLKNVAVVATGKLSLARTIVADRNDSGGTGQLRIQEMRISASWPINGGKA